MYSEQLKALSCPDKRCDGEYEICNRCSPENARWNGAKSEFTFRAQEIMHETFPQKFDLSSISNRLFVNKSYLCRVFKKETGMTLLQYYNEIRCYHAKRLLIHSELGVAYIAIQVGFCNLSQFCYVFKKVVGKTPCEYRRSYFKSLKEK